MPWIAAAIVFCFLMWKWPRRTLKGLGICTIIGASLSAILAGTIKYQDYKREELRKAIKVTVKYDTARCEGSEYPLAIGLVNHSSSEVYKIEFRVSAYVKGRSSNVVEYGGGYSSDYILNPEEGVQSCWKAPKLKEGYTPERLDWRAYVTWVETSKK